MEKTWNLMCFLFQTTMIASQNITHQERFYCIKCDEKHKLTETFFNMLYSWGCIRCHASKLNQLLHSHHIYSGQFWEPAISMCATVSRSLNEAKFLAQGDGRCLWRADVHSEVGVASLFAEIKGLPRQLWPQVSTAPRIHHSHVGYLAVTPVSGFLCKLWASCHHASIAVIKPFTFLLSPSPHHCHHPHHLGLAVDICLRNPQTVIWVFQVVGLNVSHVCAQPPRHVAFEDLVTAVINEASPCTAKE